MPSRGVIGLVAGAMIIALSTMTAAAQQGDTCEWPFTPEYYSEHVLDMAQWHDDMNPGLECAGTETTGADVFFAFSGYAAGGVFLTADFDALVYVLGGTCEPGCVDAGSGFEGMLFFDTGWPPEQAQYSNPIVVIDALNGQSGSITVRFEIDSAVPASPETWGRIKDLYR